MQFEATLVGTHVDLVLLADSDRLDCSVDTTYNWIGSGFDPDPMCNVEGPVNTLEGTVNWLTRRNVST